MNSIDAAHTDAAQWLRGIAKEVEDNPTRWTQNALARDADDYETSPKSHKAVCWCAEGFMARDNKKYVLNLMPGLIWYANDDLSSPTEFVQWFRSTADSLENL